MIKIDNAKDLQRVFNNKKNWRVIHEGIYGYGTQGVRFNRRRLIPKDAMAKLKSFWYEGLRLTPEDISICITDKHGQKQYSKNNLPVSICIDGGVPRIEIQEKMRVQRPIDIDVNNFWKPAQPDLIFNLNDYFLDPILPTELEMVALSLDEPTLYKAIQNKRKGIKFWQLIH